MHGTIEHASTFGAHLTGPTRWVATLIGRLLGMNPSPIYGKEVQGEADLSDRSHLVIHLGRDHLLRTRHELDLQRRLARHGQPETTVVHVDSPPGARSDAVCPTEPRGQAVLIPLRTGAHQS